MIEFIDITKTFKTDFWAKSFKALDNLSFNIETGKLIGFLGANGAGKTTSIKIMMDFIRQDSGKIIFNKSLGKNKKAIFSNIGFVPERPYFYPYLTGREFVEYMSKLNDVKRSDILKYSKKWANYFAIEHAMDRKIHGYSKGMLQRLGFVSALVHNPSMIILDEPLSGLDPLGRNEIKKALVELNREGKTIFFSSHIVSDVEEICERVVVLQQGKKIYQGSIDKLIHDNLSSNYSIKFYVTDLEIVKKLDEEEECVPLGDDLYQILCHISRKHDVIEKLISQGVEIISVNPDQPTLEQVIYKINK